MLSSLLHLFFSLLFAQESAGLQPVFICRSLTKINHKHADPLPVLKLEVLFDSKEKNASVVLIQNHKRTVLLQADEMVYSTIDLNSAHALFRWENEQEESFLTMVFLSPDWGAIFKTNGTVRSRHPSLNDRVFVELNCEQTPAFSEVFK